MATLPIPRWALIGVLVTGVFVSYGASSVLQEYVIKELAYTHSSVVTFAISFVTTVIGGLFGGFRNRKAPLKSHVAVGILSCATIGLANYSLVFLNFGTQVIFKSSKVLPVMIVGTLVWKKEYNFKQYASAMLLIVGLILFTLADMSVTPNFNFFGVLVVCGSLTADAFIGNVQESVFAQGASQLEALTYPSLFSAILGLVFVLINDDPFVTWSDTVNSPAAMVSMALTGLVNSTGLYFVLKMIDVVGAAQTVFATSLRKACSLVLSYMLFPKPITPQHFVGGGLVCLGIYFNSKAKGNAKGNPTPAAEPSTAAASAAPASQLDVIPTDSESATPVAPPPGPGGEEDNVPLLVRVDNSDTQKHPILGQQPVVLGTRTLPKDTDV